MKSSSTWNGPMPGKIVTKRNYTTDKKQKIVSCDLSTVMVIKPLVPSKVGNILTGYGTISFSKQTLLYIPQIQI